MSVWRRVKKRSEATESQKGSIETETVSRAQQRLRTSEWRVKGRTGHLSLGIGVIASLDLRFREADIACVAKYIANIVGHDVPPVHELRDSVEGDLARSEVLDLAHDDLVAQSREALVYLIPELGDQNVAEEESTFLLAIRARLVGPTVFAIDSFAALVPIEG